MYTRELFAIIEAIKKWRQYLIGRHFQVFTDQKSLKELMVQTVQTSEQHKWAAKLQGYSFEILYKHGKNNMVADALSRKYEEKAPAGLVLSLSSTVPYILSQLKKHFATETTGKQLVSQLFNDTSTQHS